jgi:hypothetical protein
MKVLLHDIFAGLGGFSTLAQSPVGVVLRQIRSKDQLLLS